MTFSMLVRPQQLCLMSSLLFSLCSNVAMAQEHVHSEIATATSFNPEASAQSVQLGVLQFPNSGSSEAQTDFINGVLYLHSFEYEPARKAFQRAQEIDPTFALAYWGEAMTHHHSLWDRQRPDLGKKALLKFGSTSEERSQKTKTERERGFLKAVEAVFGLTESSMGRDKLERDILYRDQMREMFERYPEDHEVAAFYGLSILGVGSANREYSTYMRAAAVILPIWDENKAHPGAAHYLIHSWDDPVHAILGLPMADAYLEIAPDAAHAQHMTSHIYTALGHWDDVVAANLRGFRVESAKTTETEVMSKEERHYTYWLIYGRLQQGRWNDAKHLLENMRRRLDKRPSPEERAYFGAMIARYMFDTEDWTIINELAAPSQMEIPTAHYNFARAFSAIKLGKIEEAKALRMQIKPGGAGNPEISLSEDEVEILVLELDAMIAHSESNYEVAEQLMREALALGQKIPFRYGPPRLAKPTSELLGDVLFEMGKYESALTAYRGELEHSLQRTNSLLGVARSARQSGQLAVSKNAYQLLSEIWHDADAGIPTADEARSRSASD
jgi:tetratricopeptide (TPR) repeat protein